ncbi:hypothetical protein XENORESO_000937 [Xenotaenia resolanae]|uniref:Uncharacterized protein n=1 Tax=Xenotaenia resolanae TaxID=208358 RepID=A0ABV0W1T8_9TELE
MDQACVPQSACCIHLCASTPFQLFTENFRAFGEMMAMKRCLWFSHHNRSQAAGEARQNVHEHAMCQDFTTGTASTDKLCSRQDWVTEVVFCRITLPQMTHAPNLTRMQLTVSDKKH